MNIRWPFVWRSMHEKVSHYLHEKLASTERELRDIKEARDLERSRIDDMVKRLTVIDLSKHGSIYRIQLDMDQHELIAMDGNRANMEILADRIGKMVAREISMSKFIQ